MGDEPLRRQQPWSLPQAGAAGYGKEMTLPQPLVSQEKVNRLIGPVPESVGDSYQHRHHGQESHFPDRHPIPKWDGKNPAKTLQPWLRDLRIDLAYLIKHIDIFIFKNQFNINILHIFNSSLKHNIVMI